MKKKFLSISLMLVLLTGVASPTLAASDKDVEDAIKMIEKTNVEIDEKIEKAVEKADELQEDYLLDIREIEEGGKVLDIKIEKNEVLAELEMSKHDLKKQVKLNEKLEKLNEKMVEEQAKIDKELAEINSEITELTRKVVTAEDKDTKKLEKKLNKLTDKLGRKSIELNEKTAKYTHELNKVITDTYDVTLKMSAETIAKAAERGVQAECSWKLVRFADQWVWIDPIRVVGRR
ncbi:hypothetical protein GPDM_01990 [Planococcus donghaensis MPA1U2]|uniref:Uncharacterized protein n=1 Tax=Planococcus donghaensis MPA1U2 TaxID=933115 RepID=E7RD70_9BACL|nr:hypothetical protein [Planococcus donghaensis]EGA91020.1 hypothetical protein GPDM_01990 [Planococcus donghaensis MPA1U2]